jgi:hypothetical protein
VRSSVLTLLHPADLPWVRRCSDKALLQSQLYVMLQGRSKAPSRAWPGGPSMTVYSGPVSGSAMVVEGAPECWNVDVSNWVTLALGDS